VRVRVPRRIFPITVICSEEQRGQVIDGLHLNEDAPTAMVQINLTSSVAGFVQTQIPNSFCRHWVEGGIAGISR
jgi:hypothetical protein